MMQFEIYDELVGFLGGPSRMIPPAHGEATMRLKNGHPLIALKGPAKDPNLAAEIDQLEMLSRHESVRLKLIEGAGRMSINYDLEAIIRQEDLKAVASEIHSKPVRAAASGSAMARA